MVPNIFGKRYLHWSNNPPNPVATVHLRSLRRTAVGDFKEAGLRAGLGGKPIHGFFKIALKNKACEDDAVGMLGSSQVQVVLSEHSRPFGTGLDLSRDRLEADCLSLEEAQIPEKIATRR